MAVSPIGNVILVNQNMSVASNHASNLQNRFDLQNVAAMMKANDKREEILKVRPTEETHYIGQDEDDYEKVKEDEERKHKQSPREIPKAFVKDESEESEDEESNPSLLDLKI